MSAKHTPGPWEFLSPDDGNCGAITAKTGWICDFAEEPSNANARLMAAAPDLLEALRQIVEQHGQWNNGIWASNIARVAIAKATGETK